MIMSRYLIVGFGVWCGLAMSAAPLAAQQLANDPSELAKPAIPNNLPSLGETDVQGVETVELRVSCKLSEPLSTQYEVTLQKDGADTKEPLFDLTADRCKYVYDDEERRHEFFLNISLSFYPTPQKATVCPNVAIAVLLEISSDAADLAWPGKTIVLREGALNSPEMVGASGHTMSMVSIRTLSNRAKANPVSFETYLSAEFPVFADRADNWAQRGSFSYGLAAASPLPNGGFFEGFGANGTTGGAKGPTDVKTKDIAVDIRVLQAKAACVKDDGTLIDASPLKEKS